MEVAPTTFEAVAALAEQLAGTASRLAKRAAIAEAIGRAHAAAPETADAGRFAQYLAGLPFAEADPRKLNAGGALLSRAVLAVSGVSEAQLTTAYRRHGDMGAAAFDLLAPLRSASGVDADAREGLPLAEVERIFAAMAVAPTTAIRAGLVTELLGRASALEAKYLLKLMLGDMRIGVKESLVEEAMAAAAGVEVAAVRHAVMLEADLAGAVRRAFAGTLGEACMRLFHPLGFMLASPVETPDEAIARFTEKPKKVTAVKKPRGKKAVVRSTLDDLRVDHPADAEAFADVAVLDTIAVAPEREADAELSAAAAADVVYLPGRAAGMVEAYLEDKYDGMRAQVHGGDPAQPGRVAIYSRNREDITESFPELVEAFARVGDAGVGAMILDGEILGWDYAGEGGGRALPFAVMGQRIGRKRVDNAMRRSVPVVFMAFDLLFSEGELRLELPLRERRARLEAIAARLASVTRSPLELPEVPAKARRGRGKASAESAESQDQLFAVATEAAVEAPVAEAMPRLLLSPARLVESAEAIDVAYADARARANEGVMLKAAGSAYLPGRRGLAWVKLKRELATLDVVITGAEFGSGRRSQFLSDYTFAVRGERGELLNVGKAYSGVTDAEIVELTAWLEAHTLEDFGHFRTVEPALILEVAFNNIMRSDRHASGFALRFPRILRIRTDKPLAEIDTVARVEEVYQSQVDKPAESAAAEGQE